MSGVAAAGTPAARRADLERAIAERLARRARQGIEPRPAGTPPDISLSQQRLWVLEQMHPGASVYNAAMTMRLVGPLRPDAVRRGLDRVVARHEALRTTMVAGPDGVPVGRLLPADCGAPWDVVDLSGDAAGAGDLEPRLAAAAREPFDLGADVMLRGRLFVLGPDESVLLLVTHHAASDGWSRGALFTELAELYNAEVGGREAALPALPVQYGDYARWQRQLLGSGHYDAALSFWAQELAGADLVTELPTDRPRPATPTFRGARLPFEDDELGERLRSLGRQAAATPFMTCLAVTAVVLAAVTGQTGFLLGSPSANRDRPEVADLIGFFVDTVIVRVRLDGDPTFAELLARCRTAVLGSLGHPVPLDRLVEAVRPKRVAGRNPLFQVNYRMQGAPPPTPAFDGARSERIATDIGTSRFDLAFGFVDAPGPLRGYLEYNSALFDRATVRAWADATLALVRHAVDDPGRHVDDLVAELRAGIAGQIEGSRPVAATSSPRSIRRRARSTG